MEILRYMGKINDIRYALQEKANNKSKETIEIRDELISACKIGLIYFVRDNEAQEVKVNIDIEGNTELIGKFKRNIDGLPKRLGIIDINCEEYLKRTIDLDKFLLVDGIGNFIYNIKISLNDLIKYGALEKKIEQNASE